MSESMKDLVANARSRVDVISPQDAQAARDTGDVILDVREPGELTNDGAIDGAVHVPRSVLESQADPDSGKGDNTLTAMLEMTSPPWRPGRSCIPKQKHTIRQVGQARAAPGRPSGRSRSTLSAMR